MFFDVDILEAYTKIENGKKKVKYEINVMEPILQSEISLVREYGEFK